MIEKCRKCGRAETQTIADAKALGLLQELQSGVYTCGQISEWANEQRLAWSQATQEDNKGIDDVTIRPEFGETDVVLVRLRRQQIPRYRNPDLP